MKNILILIILSVFISCGTENNTKENNEMTDLSKQLAQDLMALWESGDTLNTARIFHEECKYADVANNHTFMGINGVNQYVTHIHKWASDVNMETRSIHVSGNMGYAEWTLTAKHTSPIKGRVPVATNKDITLNGATLLEFKDGKISKASDYMDVLGFVIQLGSKVELPGGVIIEQ